MAKQGFLDKLGAKLAANAKMRAQAKRGEATGNASPEKQQARATAYFAAQYSKPLLIIAAVIVVFIALGSVSSGVVTAAQGLNRPVSCLADTDNEGFFTSAEENGFTISDEDKETIRGIEDQSSCKQNGSGFNGEVFPPALGNLTSRFAEKNDVRGNKPHTGADLAKSCGSPIYAYAGGEVVTVIKGTEAKSGPGGYVYPGGTVIIKHTEEVSTMYHHLKGSTTLVEVGDIVSAGQQIASQWSNGRSTGCHLHWEYYINGERTDAIAEAEKCGLKFPIQEFPAAPIMCGGAAGGGTTSEPKVYAKTRIQTLWPAYSSSQVASEFSCLDKLWIRESNWRVNALNPAFDRGKPPTPEYQAYGIVQAAPGSKMASAGADWKTNPATQINWGLDYIKNRYGSPCAAWDHSERKNWY